MLSPQKPTALARAYAWFSAVINDDMAMLEQLLVHGVPIDTLHPLRHSTALMEATRLGRAGTVQWLLNHGAAPAFLCGLPQGTPLHCALRRRHWDIASKLAQAMPSCAVMDAYGATALHALCNEATDDCPEDMVLGLAAILIAKSCPLDALDHEGTTALHYCVVNDAQALALLLLRYGANPNALIPDSKVSPLVIAALDKNLPMAKLLLQYGANPHAKTREGASALTLCPAIGPCITPNIMLRADSFSADVMVH